MMNRVTLTVALLAVVSMTTSALAVPGAAPASTAIADYDPATGQIVVSYNNVNNWFIESSTNSLTGAAAMNLPQFGGLVTDNNTRIGESGFAVATHTNVDLGNVAATGLPEAGGFSTDLTITWNAGLGTPDQTEPLAIAGDTPSNNPPNAVINGPFVINIGTDPLGITLDATGSDDGGDGPSALTYTWDLDNDGSHDDADTGTSPMLSIANVVTQFGGLGLYPVSVRVFDGMDADTAGTTVELTPEPSSLVLAGICVVGMVATRRRRIA